MDRDAVVQACRSLLRPLASFLLKCGLTWREFSEISKTVFVDMASNEYGIRGRKTNISRVSILTGIHRKEVRRQRDLLDVDVKLALANKTTEATRLLSGWFQDPDFLDANAAPRILPLDGTGATFKSLCRRYGGDIPPSTMLKELKRVQAVEERNGKLHALRRYYMPVKFNPEWVLNAGSIFEDLGVNINYNMRTSNSQPTRFLGRVTNESIPVSALPEFREYLEEHGQKFLEDMDAWLTARRTDGDEECVRLGTGLFLIQGTDKK